MPRSRRQVLEVSCVVLTTVAGCTESPSGTPTSSPTSTSASTPTATSTPSGLDGEITVKGSEWTLLPEAFRATVGQELTLTFENIGEVAHNLTVGEFPTDERSIVEQDEDGTHMAKTETIQPDATTSVTFTPDSTGTFPYWCDVPGHRDAGMTGEMTTVE